MKKKFQFVIPNDKLVDYIINELKEEGEAYIMHGGKVLEFQYESATDQVDLYIDTDLHCTFDHVSEIKDFIEEMEEREENKLPKVSWIVEFYRHDGELSEEYHFSGKLEAEKFLRSFDDPANGELYNAILLIEREWKTNNEIVIATIEFERSNQNGFCLKKA